MAQMHREERFTILPAEAGTACGKQLLAPSALWVVGAQAWLSPIVHNDVLSGAESDISVETKLLVGITTRMPVPTFHR